MSGILAQGARFHLGVRPKTMRLHIYKNLGHGSQHMTVLSQILFYFILH